MLFIKSIIDLIIITVVVINEPITNKAIITKFNTLDFTFFMIFLFNLLSKINELQELSHNPLFRVYNLHQLQKALFLYNLSIPLVEVL